MKGEDLKSLFLLVCVLLSFAVFMVSCNKKNSEASTAPSSSEADESESMKRALQVNSLETHAGQTPSPRTEESAQTEKPKPYVLTDLNTIKVQPGMPSPKLGEMIYTMANVPPGICGEFWVKDSEGYVAMLAQCTGQHEGAH